jgi:hypothetical protein
MIDFGEFVTHCGSDQLGEALYQLSQSHPGDADCLVLFESSWCPDCIRATPEVKGVCVSESTRLLICNVGDRQKYRDPENYLRKEPWNLKCIPTLVCINSWSDAEINSRIDKELEECDTAEKVIELVETFIGEGRLGLMDKLDEDETAIPILPDNRDNKVAVDTAPPEKSKKIIFFKNCSLCVCVLNLNICPYIYMYNSLTKFHWVFSCYVFSLDYWY